MNGALAQATMLTSTARICTGIPRRISFSTPDGEVKGVAPVKFIAAKELTDMLNSNSVSASKFEMVSLKRKIDRIPLMRPAIIPFI